MGEGIDILQLGSSDIGRDVAVGEQHPRSESAIDEEVGVPRRIS